MREFTLSNGENEIMVNIDEKGKIVGLYTYNDTVSEVESYFDDKVYKLNNNWEKGKNPLFVHCPAVNRPKIIKTLNKCGFVVCLDETDISFEDDKGMWVKMINRYKIEEDFMFID